MFLKLRLPLLLTFIAGMYPVFTFFFAEEIRRASGVDKLEQWMVIVSGFALLLGVVNVIQTNVRKLERKESGWPYAVVLLTGLLGMGTIGILSAFNIGPFQGIGEQANGHRTPFAWLADYTYIPLQSTMFSLLAFYIASAAFRAFRARNVEATILLVAAVVVMLGRIPPGEQIFAPLNGQNWLPRFTEWLMTVPNNAAQRGIIIGAALGAASLSLRVILGIERSFLGLEKGN